MCVGNFHLHSVQSIRATGPRQLTRLTPPTRRYAQMLTLQMALRPWPQTSIRWVQALRETPPLPTLRKQTCRSPCPRRHTGSTAPCPCDARGHGYVSVGHRTPPHRCPTTPRRPRCPRHRSCRAESSVSSPPLIGLAAWIGHGQAEVRKTEVRKKCAGLLPSHLITDSDLSPFARVVDDDIAADALED